jgi:hypothetical protein
MAIRPAEEIGKGGLSQQHCWQAFLASVRHLAVEKQLDISVLHGDGTNTVAKKGAMVSG